MAHTTEGCTVAAVSGFMAVTRLTFIAIRIPGQTAELEDIGDKQICQPSYVLGGRRYTMVG